jgi:hypothetical protein
MNIPFRILPLVAGSVSVLALSGCLGGGGGSSSSSSTPQISGISSLSNDPSLVSGGDVLVEVQLADPGDADDIVVELNGEDVTSAFALRAEDRFVGLVTGLALGENTIAAYPSGQPSATAELTVKNHPASGPIFSGPHLKPWICAQPQATEVSVTNPANGQSADAQTRVSGLSDDPDANCNIQSEVSYYYQPVAAADDCTFTTTGANACFIPYNPGNPPADDQIAEFTNDRGDTVRSILAVGRGALNRGMYSLSVFHDPAQPHHPAEPQEGWNNKVVFAFGGSSGGSRFQTPPTAPFFNQQALRKGYMLATSSLNDHGNNANHALGAEALMMLKEHIVETYGPIRYTVGTGGSGGAIVQLTMASSYPGLLDGLIPTVTYADALTNGIEISDCGIFNAPGGYLESVPEAERTALTLAFTGHSSPYHCSTWNAAFLPSGNPANPANCGAGFPAELVYHPTDNPGGLRCSHPEHNANLLGKVTYGDGVTRANQPLDNQGVQYGLLALQNGSISPERFVHLNENIGYYDRDQTRISGAARRLASAEALERGYRSGMVTDGRYLANVPIIDIRYNEPAVDIHLNWRAMSVRDRLVRANGHHDNQLIWAYNQSEVSAPSIVAFEAMDAWLAAMEADDTDQPLAEKVLANKPAGLTDQCLVADGNGGAQNVGLESSSCPVKFGKSPRQVAGGPVAEDILKCELKPFNLSSADYLLAATGNPVEFTPDQRNRLQTVFADGVCDWSKPGVEQQLNPGWMSFAEGPDAVPLELTWFERP